MGDPFIAYQAPIGNQQIVTNNSNQPPDSIKKSLQYTAFDRDMSKIERETSSLGFAGGGAIAAIVVGIVAIALAGTALHEASDHGEDDHRFSSLIVGSGNTITGSSSFSMIGGGTSNSIIQDSDNSFIGGGENNSISSSSISDPTKARLSAIVGGSSHLALSNRSAIIGGDTNTIYETDGDNSAIIAGRENGVSGWNGGIFSGYKNEIGQGANESVIVGGGHHVITGRLSGIFTGGSGLFGTASEGNRIDTNNSVILGGKDHRILGHNHFAAIVGGDGLSTSAGSSFRGTTLVGQYNSNGVSELAATHNTDEPSEFRFIVGSGEGPDSRKNAFTVDQFGNLYFGTTAGASIFSRQANGSFGTGKAFTIQHPIEEEKWLVHSCLEGPEAGVYYRGKDVAPTTIKLPEYATKIADNFTVQITPIGQPRLMGSTEVNEDGVFDVMGDGKFHWHVTGRRLEIDPEPRKESIVVNRWGPYTWNEKV